MAACRVQFTWLGTRKALSPEQVAQAAGAFDAEAPFLSAGKKLLDTKHTAFRAVTSVRNRIGEAWRSVSVPFPEPGVRLVRQDRLAELDHQLHALRDELETAVIELDRHYADLKRAAAMRLGSLFNPSDYPETLIGLFAVACDYPSIEPPEYLLALSPDLYHQEQQRVRERFEEAVRLAEEAFTAEFARLVAHLTERLTGTDADGSQKVFRDPAVGNLREFFDRFRSLSVRSNAQLDQLIDEARRIVGGVEPQELREQQPLRSWVADRLSGVQAELDRLIVDRPRRRILRSTATTGAA
jgi:hypothetical protein